MADERLIEDVRNGQTEAFGELVRKYEDRLFNTCWRICGHLEDARDVTQEAFVKAFEGLATFRRASGFYTWLYRIAVNLALTRRRDAARRRMRSLDDGDGLMALAAEKATPKLAVDSDAAQGESADMQRRLAAALHELEGDFRAVVVLRDIEGMDYAGISEILGVPTGTVKSRLHRARELLSIVLRAGKAGEE